eukprot:1219963-Rhodomonas_salina.1
MFISCSDGAPPHGSICLAQCLGFAFLGGAVATGGLGGRQGYEAVAGLLRYQPMRSSYARASARARTCPVLTPGTVVPGGAERARDDELLNAAEHGLTGE